MYICVCQGITERHIVEAVNSGAGRMQDLRRDLGVATGCGRCRSCARDCLKQTLASRSPTGVGAG